MAETSKVLAGFDFPIGVPQAWADKADVVDFREFVGALAAGAGWSDFFEIADEPGQIAIRRPFYPVRPNSARQRHLLDALGLSKPDLFRICEHKTDTRRAACPLFWLVGANQVGRAALSGWRDVVIPTLREKARLWPFETDLTDCDEPGLVIAETYPADAYARVGAEFERSESKTDQAVRRKKADGILRWADTKACILSDAAREAVQDGFGDDRYGEDRFDAFVGLCGMLDTLLETATPYRPDERVRRVEGWIFGQAGPTPEGTHSRSEHAKVRHPKAEAVKKISGSEERYVTVEILIRVLAAAMSIPRDEAERIVAEALDDERRRT